MANNQPSHHMNITEALVKKILINGHNYEDLYHKALYVEVDYWSDGGGNRRFTIELQDKRNKRVYVATGVVTHNLDILHLHTKESNDAHNYY